MTVLELSSYDPKWQAHFEAERERLLSSLRPMTEGGVIFGSIEHVGSTAVPGLAANPCIDISLDTEPLKDESSRTLSSLGYHLSPESFGSAQVFVRSGKHPVKLYIVDSSSSNTGPSLLVMRDYLRAYAEIRQQYETLKRRLSAGSPSAYEEGKTAFLELQQQDAFEWHVAVTGFEPLKRLQKDLSGLEANWMVSSGWALDLFLGKPTRYHDDLDVTLFYEDAAALQGHLLARGWQFHYMVDGVYKPWQMGEALEPPQHQVHARRGDAFIDSLFSHQEGGNWLYRRDETITLALERVSHKYEGIPYLVPEAVLLYKSFTRNAGPRPKDQADFERVVPHLSAQAEAWLKEAIAKLHPDHPWLAQLD